MTAEQKADKIFFYILLVLNVVTGLGAVVFFIGCVMNTFRGNWNYVAGFGILMYIFGWIYRRIPWPETTEGKRKRELREMLEYYRGR